MATTMQDISKGSGRPQAPTAEERDQAQAAFDAEARAPAKQDGGKVQK